MDLNPDTEGGTFDFIFQVWRPSLSTNLTGCYSLVDDFISSSITTTPSEPLARVVPSTQDQLPFQPGDVLGFYVERHGGESYHNDGVVVLNDSGHSSELVWHASVDITAAAVHPSQSGSCPYPVGTKGVLSLSTHAAPVISVSVIATPCSSTPLHATTTVSPLLKHPTSTSVNLLAPQRVTTTSHSRSLTSVRAATAISSKFPMHTSLVPSMQLISRVITIVPSHALVPSISNFRSLIHPTATSLAPVEIYTISYTEDPTSSLSTLQAVGISMILFAIVILFTAATVTVLCCIRKSIALHAPSDGSVRKQSTIPLAMEEDYPDVVASLQLNENQAYGNRNLNSTRGHGIKETKFSTDNDSSSSFIEIKGNEAYAALDLLS